MPRLLLPPGQPRHCHPAYFSLCCDDDACGYFCYVGKSDIVRNKWANCASLATKGCSCACKETSLLSHSLGWSKYNAFALVFHQEPLQQGVCSNYEITTGMIVFPITPHKPQSCDLNPSHGRLHKQRWNFPAPIRGENKRIVVFMLCQQSRSCESTQVKS